MAKKRCHFHVAHLLSKVLQHKMQQLRSDYLDASDDPKLKKEFKRWEVTESDLDDWDW